MDFGKIKLLSFDCYGTLIDWRSAVVDIIGTFLTDKGAKATQTEIFELFLQADRQMISDKYLSYKEILAGIMIRISGQLGVPLKNKERYLLTDRFGDWRPFIDTVENLKILKERYQLAIISNVDDALFSITNQLLEVSFDHIITAEQLGTYKPDPGNFEIAMKRFGLEKEECMHVAQSIHHDIVPSNKLDWNNAWVNRYKEPERIDPSEFPDLEVPDLASLVRILNLETGNI